MTHRTKRNLGLSLCVALLAVAGCDDEGIETEDRIVNGVPDLAHPAVGLITFNGFRCSGTLIGPRTVLTASHCVEEDPDDYTFILNAQEDGSGNIIGDEYGVESLTFVTDPGFGAEIGLMELSDEPPDAPIPINASPISSESVVLVGYGRTDTDDTTSELMRRWAGNFIWNIWLDAFQMFDVFGGVSCFGDSGGPVLVERDGSEVIAGVIAGSSGPICDDTVATRVDFHIAWILENAGAIVSNLWQNPISNTDVNNSGETTPLDALLVINDLGDPIGHLLDLPEINELGHYPDVDGSDYISPFDALLVINEI